MKRMKYCILIILKSIKFKNKIFYIDTKKMTKEEKVDLKKKYNVEYVPTILYFSNHKLKDTLIGQQPYDKLEDFVKGKQQ